MSREKQLQEIFEAYKIETEVINTFAGPVVTIYELALPLGVSLSRFTRLSKELAIHLKVKTVRVFASENGVSVEVPNDAPSGVNFFDMISNPYFMEHKSDLAFVVGKDTKGNHIISDLEEMPHMMVAGATKSGKSVFINSVINSIMHKSSPNDVRFLIIDPKIVEFSRYKGSPFLLGDIITDAGDAVTAFHMVVKEMEARYRLIDTSGSLNLKEHNNAVESGKVEGEKLPKIIVICDEVGDLMMKSTKAEMEMLLCTLGQKARAAGIHMVIATQRPSHTIISRDVISNFPCRIAFSVNTASNSKIILDQNGAEKLLGKGDMLFAPPWENEPIRAKGAYISNEEVANLVKASISKPVSTKIDFDIEAYKEKNKKVDWIDFCIQMREEHGILLLS